MNKFLYIFLLIFLISACTHVNETTGEKDTVQTSKTIRPDKKYSIKSGIVTYETSIMGVSTISTVYFDNYGMLECHETETNLLGAKKKARFIYSEGYTYILDPEDKSGQKISAEDANNSLDPQFLDFSKIKEQAPDKKNIRQVGKEYVVDKECTVYKILIQGTEGTYWVWENLLMKMSVGQKGFSVEMIAKSIQENVPIPAEKFTIPKDYQISDISKLINE